MVFSMRAFAGQDSVTHYYYYVHKAEHSIIQKDYHVATKIYDTAFRFKKPFAVDIYNQLICNLYDQNFQLALSGCRQLVEKGAPLSFFNQSLFKDFHATAEYQQLLKEYEILHLKYCSLIDTQLVEYINKLVDADQNIHCLLPSRYNDTAFVNKMWRNDELASEILRSIMLQHNLLNEDVIGATFSEDSVLDAGPLYGILALHEIQRGGKTIDSVLWQAVKVGYLKPEIAISWLSQTGYPVLDLTRSYTIYNDTLWKRKDTDSEIIGIIDDEKVRDIYKKDLAKKKERYMSALHNVYLDDPCFIVEERIIYNFLKGLSGGTGNKYKFIISPSAIPVGSFKDNKSLKIFHDSNTVFKSR